jgi:hypothetical protein
VQAVELPAIAGGGGRGSFIDAMTADGALDAVELIFVFLMLVEVDYGNKNNDDDYRDITILRM